MTEAGAMLGCSSETAQRMARRGAIPQRETSGTRLPSIERRSVVQYVLMDERYTFMGPDSQ